MTDSVDFAILKRRLEAFPDSDLGKGATDADIREAEVALGASLRGGYRAFLRSFGWGGTGDIELFGLGADVPQHLNVVTVTTSERREAQPPLPSHLIPVMNDGGGNLYCIDVSEAYRDECPIVFWDHEAGPNQDPEQVSDSFTVWLSQRLDDQ